MMQNWRLAITPLSPVHLGTGQDYQPTAYVIDGGALYEFDSLSALEALPAGERKRLGMLLDGRPNPAMLRQVQAFFHMNRELLIATSRHQVKVNASVEAFYKERVGKVVQQQRNGDDAQNKLEIERTAWSSGTSQAIIPGSGLKGAIRTALLDVENKNSPLLQVESSKSEKKRKEKNIELQHRLFKYETGYFEKDPMRMIRLADAALTSSNEFATEVHFALNRKKHVVKKNGALVESQAEQKGLYQLLECLPAFTVRTFEGSLSIQDTGNVKSQHWPKRQFSLPEIAIACNHFYRGHLDRELETLRRMGFLELQWAERLEALLAGPVGKAVAENRAFLLRVGRHSGAESVTLNGVRSIKIMRGRDNEPEYLNEAKTLWLAGNEHQARRNLLPFGWVLVESYIDPSELSQWPEPNADTSIQKWRTGVRERQESLHARLKNERHREIQRQREAEAVAREAAEKRARLAAMSDEERQIEALRVVFKRERASGQPNPSGPLANERINLLRSALDWESTTPRVQAAELIEDTVRFLPWSKKTKRQRQEELARLREPK